MQYLKTKHFSSKFKLCEKAIAEYSRSWVRWWATIDPHQLLLLCQYLPSANCCCCLACFSNKWRVSGRSHSSGSNLPVLVIVRSKLVRVWAKKYYTMSFILFSGKFFLIILAKQFFFFISFLIFATTAFSLYILLYCKSFFPWPLEEIRKSYIRSNH